MVETADGEKRIPIDDIYSLLIDNPRCSVSAALLNRLTSNGAHIILCDEKHLPSSVILPNSIHYRPLNVIRSQINMPDEFKNELWDRIVHSKIMNQAKALRLCGGSAEKAHRLEELAGEVTDGDAGNREGIAAKMYFREMYGSGFIRMYDDAINAALNYGYTIIRSAFCRSLTAYGYLGVIGLHHINESNPFNLADDMMEPLRPVVDMWADEHSDELVDALTKQQRNELAAIVNEVIVWDGKKMRIRNAIDKYVSSLTTSIEKGDPSLLKVPEVIKRDIYADDTDD